ncbi:MAG: hypothetical protein K2M65_07740, partial [Muribaculaceae bacterium]|nr:hypothetical protein [Muribaculaceae bacterium]
LILVKDIAVSMDKIKHMENVMTINGSRATESPSQRKQILADIATVQKTLQQRREQLAELENRLENSNLYSEELKGTIAALRKQIDSQVNEISDLRGKLAKAEATIDSLNNEVDSLNTTMASVNENLDKANAASIRLENELNTCYYVIAPKSELKKHQIIETGFLRKSKLMQGDYDKDFFIIGDKRNIKSLNLHSDKAKIYTTHPDDSYLITESETKKTLIITDSDKFWSLTNYLVIQVD